MISLVKKELSSLHVLLTILSQVIWDWRIYIKLFFNNVSAIIWLKDLAGIEE